MFDTVLVANRGEIAVRVMRTLSRLGIGSIAVYSDADAGALHVRTADDAVRIGPAPAGASYLSVAAVIDAALGTGAQAIHPGYGFLSENPALARACADNGIVFVGPPVAAIEAMGDKIAAKARVAAAGVPVVPGSSGAGLSDRELAAAAEAVGFPVLIKPSAGGGGKGMRLVEDRSGLESAIESARREARSSFGDDTLLIERFLRNPRHIEIQVLADQHGNVVHLGERECSLQRRHQKIVEEAPSPLLGPSQRAAMGEQAVEAARSCGYTGAGTIEFIVSGDQPDEFFFMEMNTRLQVEHPVTEMVYAIDLVEQQLRVAAGEPLTLTQSDLQPAGHAIEARVYAEDPAHGFLPTGGRVHRVVEASGAGVRVDSGIASGTVVGSDYDPMLAKVIAWAPDRAAALARLDAALAGTAVLGIGTNIGFLRRLLADPDVERGAIDTGLVERRLESLVDRGVPESALAAVAVAPLRAAMDGAADPWSRLANWRHGGATESTRHLSIGAERFELAVRPLDDEGRTWSVGRAGGQHTLELLDGASDGTWHVSLDGKIADVVFVRDSNAWHVSVGGASATIAEALHRGAGETAAAAGGGEVRSPMPGTVVSVLVAVGDTVTERQPVAVVEAMKMEHTLTAPFAGRVVDVRRAARATVALGEVVLVIENDEELST
jgi:acetyl-CoA/propionyl-CoA carboxylase biotin carboxyl carrier protein